jgi:uncharacterized iron-regulated membrane protein
MTDTASAPLTAARDPAFHRLIFRLHFYAGIIIAPFLLILAITGSIYLFNTEIEDAYHPDWRFGSTAGEHLKPEQMVAGALSAYPDATPTRIDLPTAADRTAVVFLKPAEGRPFRVYVDPVSGQAKGTFVYEDTLIGWSDQLHGALMMGDFGDGIVELASCWAILLIGTGLYLWWPRGANGMGGVLYPRLDLRGRALWRDLHGVIGVWTSAGLLFLLMTGLPWSTQWGSNLNKVMGAVGQGYPAAYRTHIGEHGATPSEKTAEVLGTTNPGVPWTLEQAPSATSHAGHDMAGGPPIDVAQAAAIFGREGLTTGYRLVYPRNEHDVFTAYTYPDQPEGQRTIHLDQYTGEVVNDVSFENYGAGAKTVELGVAIHMGNYFGLINQLLMLAISLGGALLAITGPIMWLKRRRAGLGAPPPFKGKRAGWAVYASLAVFGMFFPLLGISLLVVLALERLILSRVRPTREWLGLA